MSLMKLNILSDLHLSCGALEMPRNDADIVIYHVVFIPKNRRKVLYAELRKHLGEVFRGLALQKDSRIEEGHLMVDHVHMMIAIPPKYAVSQVVGYIKGKSAIHLARVYSESKAGTLQGKASGREAILSRPWAR